jgi:hypothetical protein
VTSVELHGKPSSQPQKRRIKNTAGKPVESPSALRHVDEPLGLESFDLEALDRLGTERLMSSRSGPKGLQVERPVATLSFADSFCKRLDLVARHPARLA